MIERVKGLGDQLNNRQRIAAGAGAGALVLGSLAYGAKKGLDYVVASDSSSFVQVGWRPIRQKPEDVSGWVEFMGDDNAGRLPRNYKQVGMLAMNDTELGDLYEEHPGAQHAVAWQLGNRVIMGRLPNDQTFGRDNERPELSVVGTRIGRGDVQAVAGLWVPDEHRLVVPESLEAYGEPVPVEDMGDRYPMVPFV